MSAKCQQAIPQNQKLPKCRVGPQRKPEKQANTKLADSIDNSINDSLTIKNRDNLVLITKRNNLRKLGKLPPINTKKEFKREEAKKDVTLSTTNNKDELEKKKVPTKVQEKNSTPQANKKTNNKTSPISKNKFIKQDAVNISRKEVLPKKQKEVESKYKAQFEEPLIPLNQTNISPEKPSTPEALIDAWTVPACNSISKDHLIKFDNKYYPHFPNIVSNNDIKKEESSSSSQNCIGAEKNEVISKCLEYLNEINSHGHKRKDSPENFIISKLVTNFLQESMNLQKIMENDVKYSCDVSEDSGNIRVIFNQDHKIEESKENILAKAVINNRSKNTLNSRAIDSKKMKNKKIIKPYPLRNKNTIKENGKMDIHSPITECSPEKKTELNMNYPTKTIPEKKLQKNNKISNKQTRLVKSIDIERNILTVSRSIESFFYEQKVGSLHPTKSCPYACLKKNNSKTKIEDWKKEEFQVLKSRHSIKEILTNEQQHISRKEVKEKYTQEDGIFQFIKGEEKRSTISDLLNSEIPPSHDNVSILLDEGNLRKNGESKENIFENSNTTGPNVPVELQAKIFDELLQVFNGEKNIFKPFLRDKKLTLREEIYEINNGEHICKKIFSLQKKNETNINDGPQIYGSKSHETVIQSKKTSIITENILQFQEGEKYVELLRKLSSYVAKAITKYFGHGNLRNMPHDNDDREAYVKTFIEQISKHKSLKDLKCETDFQKILTEVISKSPLELSLEEMGFENYKPNKSFTANKFMSSQNIETRKFKINQTQSFDCALNFFTKGTKTYPSFSTEEVFMTSPNNSEKQSDVKLSCEAVKELVWEAVGSNLNSNISKSISNTVISTIKEKEGLGDDFPIIFTQKKSNQVLNEKQCLNITDYQQTNIYGSIGEKNENECILNADDKTTNYIVQSEGHISGEGDKSRKTQKTFNDIQGPYEGRIVNGELTCKEFDHQGANKIGEVKELKHDLETKKPLVKDKNLKTVKKKHKIDRNEIKPSGKKISKRDVEISKLEPTVDTTIPKKIVNKNKTLKSSEQKNVKTETQKLGGISKITETSDKKDILPKVEKVKQIKSKTKKKVIPKSKHKINQELNQITLMTEEISKEATPTSKKIGKKTVKTETLETKRKAFKKVKDEKIILNENRKESHPGAKGDLAKRNSVKTHKGLNDHLENIYSAIVNDNNNYSNTLSSAKYVSKYLKRASTGSKDVLLRHWSKICQNNRTNLKPYQDLKIDMQQPKKSIWSALKRKATGIFSQPNLKIK